MKQNSFIDHIHPSRLPAERIRISSTFCLGGAAFFLFITLCMTGLLLSVYYVPTPDGAIAGLHDLDQVIPFGRPIRSFHFWAGQLMVIAVLLHTVRVVAAGAYLPPRHFNWLIGLVLMLLTLGLDFSGYVLRWDSRSFRAAQVISQLLGQIPLMGPALQKIFFGGSQMAEAGLLRFYIFHCLGGPGLSFILIMYHFWRVRKDGKLKKAL